VIVVWSHEDGVRDDIWSSRYIEPDMVPPILTLIEPEKDSLANYPIIRVSGVTEPGATLDINGISTTVSSNGSFSCGIVLFDGANEIRITATDPSGNSAIVVRSVTYNDPYPRIVEDMKSLNETLTSLEDSFSDIQDEIISLKERMNRAEAALSAIDVNMTSLKETMISMEDEVLSIEENLTTFRKNIQSIEIAIKTSEKNSTLFIGMLLNLRKDVTTAQDDIVTIQQDLDLIESRMNSTGSDPTQGDIDELKDDIDYLRSWNSILTTALIIMAILCVGFILFILRNKKGNISNTFES
jgi:hypothetical protein